MDDRTSPPQHPETICAQAMEAGDAATRALVPPIHTSTTYLRDADNGYSSGYCYGRTDNVSTHQAEAVIAALEGAPEAMLFGSGMAAATSVILALPGPTHIIASQVMYYGFRSWLMEVARYGHTVSFVDTSDLDAVRKAVKERKTGLVWIETPSNPTWTITDIAAVCEIAHEAGALVCVDSTAATPVVTRPLELGADIVMHSATKYLNGHSDVIAGALATARTGGHWARIQKLRGQLGAILGPFESWLLLRGMRTLHVRVRAQMENAAHIAAWLATRPEVTTVLYPGLVTHPGHQIAQRQMKGGFGAMLSFRVRGGEAAAIACAARVELWKRATSLGGVESLIEHRSSIEGPTSSCPTNLLRLSVGIEHAADLCADLGRALNTIAMVRPSVVPVGIASKDRPMGTVAVAIICKTPRPGHSKTRLSPPLMPEDCAAISACFIRDLARTIDTLHADGDVTGYALYTPAGSEAELRKLLPAGFGLVLQGEGDLGARLLKGTADFLAAGHDGAVIINSDSPTLPREILRDAVDGVRQRDQVVLSPAVDGGYTLVGLSKPHAGLFENIPWSTPEVYDLTLDRAKSIGVSVLNVAPWYDVDDAHSLRMLEGEFQGERPAFSSITGAPAPASQAFLAKRAAMSDQVGASGQCAATSA